MRTLRPAQLAALNFGIQFVWGAILAVSLQARSIELAPQDGVRAYATIASIGAALAAVVQLFAGRMADARRAEVGHRREFYWWCVAAVPALLWFFLAPTFAQLMLAFFALQIALNVATGPYQAAIPDHAPRDRQGETSSWMSGLQSLGNAAGLLVAGFVHERLLVASILSGGLLASFGATIAHVRNLDVLPVTPAPLRLNRTLRTMLVSRGLANLGFYLLLGFLLFFVRDSLGVTAPAALRMQTALLFLTFTCSAIPGAILAGRPSDRYDKRLVVSVANATILIALCMLAGTQALALAYAAAALAGIAWGAFATSDWALACVLLPRGSMAAAMGVWNIATAVPQIVAPLIGAPLVLYFNGVQFGLGPRAAILSAAIAFALATGFIWRLPAALTAPPA